MASDSPRLAAFDLDGTLLNAESVVSSYTRSILADLGAPDRHFVVATGRGFDSASERLAEVEPIRWVICDNGASLYDLSTGDLVTYNAIASDAVTVLLDELEQHVPGVAVCWGSLSEGFAWTKRFASIFGVDANQRRVVDDSEPIPDDALKVLLAHPDHSVEELLHAMNDLATGDLAVTTSGLSFVEVTAPGIDKSRRLAELCDRLEVDRGATIAFGDAMNDHAMLQWVGTGYAMANAHPEVKQAADAVTERSNDDDGVAHTLRTVFG